MNLLTFKILIIVENDGEGYHAYCPDLEGIHVYGDTPEDALSVAKDAVEVYLKMSLAHGDPIPIGLLRPFSLKDGLLALWGKYSFRSRNRREFLENVEFAPA